ncbi:unnamed protein product [Rotaria sp. Silwood2]|nr:unnamed protein product [Rotaria sp. Silwood2]
MSPIQIPVNQPTVITVPVADADGDPTRCRWSTSSNGIDECGGVCPPSSLPSGAIIYPNCTIIITVPPRRQLQRLRQQQQRQPQRQQHQQQQRQQRNVCLD